MSSGSSSANGGSGGHSSDEQSCAKDKISMLKKRNYRDYQMQYSKNSEGTDLCDELKLFKILDHERKKKVKLSHQGHLTGPIGSEYCNHRVPASTNFYSQRPTSLKRKRKDSFLSNELKQRF